MKGDEMFSQNASHRFFFPASLRLLNLLSIPCVFFSTKPIQKMTSHDFCGCLACSSCMNHVETTFADLKITFFAYFDVAFQPNMMTKHSRPN